MAYSQSRNRDDENAEDGRELESWQGFIANLPQDPPLREVILASWKRSSAAGLERHDSVSFRRVTDEQLAGALAENRELLEVAKPHLDWVSTFMSEIEHVAYLTDRHGVVLYSVGDLAQSSSLHLSPGYDWSEQTMGTNGAGTAIAADRPIAVVGSEHFSTAFENCTCTGAPIHLDGRVIGAIDLSTGVKEATPDRLALVAHVAFVIDRELALREEGRQRELYRRVASELRAQKEELLRSKAQLEALLDNTTAVIYLVDRDARLLRINRRWESLFEMSNEACAGRSVYEFFPAAVADRFAANNRRVLEAGHAMEFEEEATVHGERRTYLSVKVPIFDASGEAYAVCGISTDITERIAAEQREREVLQEENLRKERFVAALAHELRSPISAILSAGEVLERTAEGGAVKSAGGVVVRQAIHVANLLEKLLEASRVSSGRLSLEKSPAELRSVLEQAIEAVRPAIGSKDQHLAVSLPPAEPLVVHGDRTRLTQVFVNLLDNASRYTGRGKKISLDARRTNGAEMVVCVRDEGRGIDPAAIPKVFDLLFQAGESSGAGLGLGLSLVRAIVQAHGGSVSAHSEGPGQGSEFVVRLPAAD